MKSLNRDDHRADYRSGWVAVVLMIGAAPLLAQEPAPVEPAAAAAALPDSGAVIAELLGSKWERKGTDNSAARQLAEQALAIDPGNERLAYAWGLHQMKSYRYRDAARQLRSLTQAGSTRLETWVMRSWAELVSGQHDLCLATLREMKRQFSAPTVPAEAAAGFYRHAGKLIGFLQGPAQGHSNAELLNAVIGQIAAGATAEQLAEFNAEQSAVLDKYDQLCKSHAVAAEQFLEDAAAKGKVEAERIAASNETLAQRREQVQPELERLSAEATAQLSGIDQQASPLLGEATALDASANQLAWSVNSLRNEVFFLQQALAVEIDPALRYPLVLRLNQLYPILRQSEYDLSATRSRLVGLQSQLNVLGVQRNQIAQTYDGSLRQTRGELNQIQREQRRNDRRLEQIADGPSQVTGAALALENRKDLLSTYYVLPLELYRLELQDEVAAGK
jgi:hypothetical protein